MTAEALSGNEAIAGLDGPGRPLGLAEFQMVFTEIRGDLVRFLTRRTGNGAVAADLAHDVFEKLPTIRADIPDPRRARSYLLRIANNLAIDHGRTEGRRREILDGSRVLFEDSEPSLEDAAISRDQLRRLERALAELPPRVAEVLTLSRVQGLKHREIARRLGISVSLVEKYQARALAHCREILRD